MATDREYQRRRQIKQARLEIEAELYKKGWSVRKIRTEVMRRLNLEKLSTGTVQSDIQTMLQEWRDSRVKDVDCLLELELARIDDTCKELWEQWERSKEDYERTNRKRKGKPTVNNSQQGNGQQNQQANGIRTTEIEERTESFRGLGNTQYIAEIRQQLAERRKLLGLYAPEKREVSGSMSFAQLLMDSGVVDDEPKQEKEQEQ